MMRFPQGGTALDFRLDHLANHTRHLPQVAAWQHAQFSYLNPATTLAQRTSRLSQSLNPERLPLALVALAETGEVLGSASILSMTLTHQHLTPWLSSVFVPAELRGHGIASALSLKAVAEAARLGFETLYLFTPHSESLYARLGWNTFDTVDHNGLPLKIMARSTHI